ncbi:MAG: AAA family ATPase [Flavobacteriales bacterium]|nr:AAA family ATPase [Flavobacteriales bacterium]
MSRKIGFTNFRRFIDFEPIEYDRVTFLVGRNNSGKSTVVKALMLVVNYLKSGRIDQISFSDKVLESVNIVTYERAKNRLAKENLIRFIHALGPFEVALTVTGEDGKTSGRVQRLSIQDKVRNLLIEVAPEQRTISITAEGAQEQGATRKSSALEELERRIQSLRMDLKGSGLPKTSAGYIKLNQELRTLVKRRPELKKAIKAEMPAGSGYTVSSFYPTGLDLSQALQGFLDEIRRMSLERYKKLAENKAKKKKDLEAGFANYKAAQANRRKLEESVQAFFEEVDRVGLYYLGASSIKQPALYAIRDRNNALAQAIDDYQQLGVLPGEEAHRFILQWLSDDEGFEVGDDFEVVMRSGEAYEVNVFSHGTKIPLSDKGMGSIQAMLLLFRLACIIHKTKVNPAYRPIVIIEEPELNLHPKLQSRLADLFLGVHRKHGVEFIIETHSEYAIRKTQALVKVNEFEVPPNENPFTIVYFDKDGLSTWKMKYRPDGRFENEFGEGFYDISGNLTLDLI